ncbi:MAG: lysylphosphatidylglycerol synthase transmembrane domain-containing protein [candidate division Zixibacteria bacterium]
MTGPETAKKDRLSAKAIILRVVKTALAAVAIYFVIRQVQTHSDEVLGYDWQIDPVMLLLSVIVHILALTGFARVWALLMAGFGYSVSIGEAFKIAYLANLGRYIPGRIWQVFGMTYLARQIGIQEEVSIASFVLVQMFALPSAFLATALIALFDPAFVSAEASGMVGSGIVAVSVLIFAVSLLVVFAPNRAVAMLNLLLRRINRPEITFELSASRAALIYSGYFICWLVYGFAFWLLLHGILSGPNISLSAGIGTFVLAYQIGYLAIFTPGGLGVRELVMIALLNPFLGTISAGVAVAARLWNVLIEIIVALIAWLIRFKPESRQSNS